MLLPRSILTLPGLGSPPVAADLSAIASMHAPHWIRSVSVGEYIYSVDIHVNFVEALALEEVLVLTPRGRYDVDMFPEFLRLRGKTYDYKILYTSISRLFLLPKDDQHVLFIVSDHLSFYPLVKLILRLS